MAYYDPVRQVFPKRGMKSGKAFTLIIVGRSNDRPNPYTTKSSGKPIDSNISGLNMPEFPISTAAQPR